MRPLVLSLGICLGALSVAWAQNAGDTGSVQQLPVGQTFKNFEFPLFQDGQLKYTVTAVEAKGITQNRAETTNLKILAYTNGAVTATVTSPKADLYVAERKMRTKDTVQIIRADQEATAQICDFDMTAKKYLLRTNVRVILKNFDPGLNPAAGGSAAPSPAGKTAPSVSTLPASAPLAPRPSLNNDSLLDSPGAYASTNSAPLPPTSTNPK